MAYSLKSFMHQYMPQAEATSYNEPIKLPTIARGGSRGGMNLATLSQPETPWSGVGNIATEQSVPDMPGQTESGRAVDVNPSAGTIASRTLDVFSVVAAPPTVLGLIMKGGKYGEQMVKGRDKFAEMIDNMIDKAKNFILGTPAEAPNPNPDIPGLEYGGQPNPHGEAAVQSGAVAPVPGGVTPNEGDVGDYGGQ